MMLGDTATRVLLAVLNQRRPTVRSVAMEAGRSVMGTHNALTQLRDEGLVTWDEGKQATLRPTVQEVPIAQVFGATMGAQSSGPGAALTARDLADTPGGADIGER